MKSIPLTIAAAFVAAMAFTILPLPANGQPPVPAEVPPPPGIDDPGVGTQPAPAEEPAAAPAQAGSNDPLAPLPKPDARLVRDKASRDAAATAQRVAASEVTTRKQGDDTVEEYRQKGKVWMIRIVPQNGPTQTFMANDASGRLLNDPNQGPVSPVYYTLYEWQ